MSKLYKPAGNGIFASRKAHRLAYRCQRQSPYDRAISQAFKHRQRLGADGGIGVPKTEAHKAKISAAHIGSKKPWTSIRNSAGKGKPGHPSTPETNLKISLATTGKPKRGLAERNKQRVWTSEMRTKSAASRTNRKLSDEDVRSVLERLERGETQVSIARVFGVSFSLISRIKRGKARVLATEVSGGT